MPIPLAAMIAMGAGAGALGGKQKSNMANQPTVQTTDMHRSTDPYNPQNMGDAQQYLGGQGSSGNQILDFLLSSGVGLLGGSQGRNASRQNSMDSIINGVLGSFQDKYGG